MATNQLKLAYEAAQKRPEKDQDMLAKRILEEIEEQEWDEIVDHPKVMQYICKLADEALEDYLAGETEEEYNHLVSRL